jgi:tetratricopeptide (TPR) repeat protein
LHSHRELFPPIPKGLEAICADRVSEYIRFLEQALRRDPASADLHTCLGLAHIKSGDVYQALACLERAIALDGNHFFARIRYADLLFRIRAFPQAMRQGKRARSLARSGSEWRMAQTLLADVRHSKQSPGPAIMPPCQQPSSMELYVLAGALSLVFSFFSSFF